MLPQQSEVIHVEKKTRILLCQRLIAAKEKRERECVNETN